MAALRKNGNGNGGNGGPIQIAVINESTVASDAEVKAATQALQTQVTRDFAPAWCVDALLTFVSAGAAPPKGSWWLVVLDNFDQAGALGYHDLTTEGLPLGNLCEQCQDGAQALWPVNWVTRARRWPRRWSIPARRVTRWARRG